MDTDSACSVASNPGGNDELVGYSVTDTTIAPTVVDLKPHTITHVTNLPHEDTDAASSFGGINSIAVNSTTETPAVQHTFEKGDCATLSITPYRSMDSMVNMSERESCTDLEAPPSPMSPTGPSSSKYSQFVSNWKGVLRKGWLKDKESKVEEQIPPTSFRGSKFRRSISMIKLRTKRLRDICFGTVNFRHSDDLGSLESTIKSTITLLASSLLYNGMPADGVDYLVNMVSNYFGLDCMLDGSVNGLHITLTTRVTNSYESKFVKFKSTTWDLNKLCKLEDLSHGIVSSKVSILEAKKKIDHIIQKPPLYREIMCQVLALALCSISLALLLGAPWPELIAAFICGGVVGYLTTRLPDYVPSLGAIVPSICTLIAGLIALSFKALFARWGIPFQTTSPIFSGVILLLPGLSLTTGIGEVLRKYTKAGLLRFIAAFTVSLQMAAGLAVAKIIETAAGVQVSAEHKTFEYPVWAQLLVLPTAALGYLVDMRTPRGPITLFFTVGDAYVAYFFTHYLATLVRPELASFLSSFMVQFVAMIYGSLTRHQPRVITSCVILFIVPGGMSVRGLISLIEKDAYNGATLIMQALLTCAAISFGLYLGDSLIPLSHRHELWSLFKKWWSKVRELWRNLFVEQQNVQENSSHLPLP